jgi:hypothetical protein
VVAEAGGNMHVAVSKLSGGFERRSGGRLGSPDLKQLQHVARGAEAG